MSTPAISPRPYQLATIEEVRAFIRAGKKRILMCIPTGGGKTITAATMLVSALSKGSRVMFVAHRLELIDQTVTTFHRLGITDIGVIRAKDPRTNELAPIQIASIQTLARRAKPLGIKVIIIDECHRANAKSYVKHVIEAYPDAVIIGLTATPIRGDGKPLGDVFEEIVIGARYSQLIEQGYIDAPIVYSTPVLPDLSGVGTKGGDFNQEQLDDAVNRSALIGDIVSEWQKRAEGRRSVVFAVSIAHSKAIVDDFIRAGVKAEHLDGTTEETARRAILARLEAGTTQVVSNVGVLCEGWDMPSCKYLAIARPTKSLGLWMQMAGRILRPCGTEPIILDHGGNVDRMAKQYGDTGLPHEDRAWSLTSKVKGSGKSQIKMCPGCFAYIPNATRECPHCAHDFRKAQALAEQKELEHLTHVELALRTLDGDDAKLSFYRSLCRKASELGLKPGWIYHSYVERFKEEPPREWQKAMRAGRKDDSVWREREQRRTAQNWGDP